MPDPQMKRLYAWEANMGWDESTITFPYARALIINACKLFKVKPPEIKLHTTRNLPWYHHEVGVISLQRDKYLNVPISLHEASHHITWNKHPYAQDHGPTFLGIYLTLLARNNFDSYETAEYHGLKWK